MSASLFDLALIWYQLDPASCAQFLGLHSKSESAEELSGGAIYSSSCQT